MGFFCVFPLFHWGDIVGEVLPKARGSEKNIKMEGWTYTGVVYRRRGLKFVQTMIVTNNFMITKKLIKLNFTTLQIY